MTELHMRIGMKSLRAKRLALIICAGSIGPTKLGIRRTTFAGLSAPSLQLRKVQP